MLRYILYGHREGQRPPNVTSSKSDAADYIMNDQFLDQHKRSQSVLDPQASKSNLRMAPKKS